MIIKTQTLLLFDKYNFLLCTFSPGHVYIRIMSYIYSTIQCVANYWTPQKLLLKKNGRIQEDGKVEGSEKKFFH